MSTHTTTEWTIDSDVHGTPLHVYEGPEGFAQVVSAEDVEALTGETLNEEDAEWAWEAGPSEDDPRAFGEAVTLDEAKAAALSSLRAARVVALVERASGDTLTQDAKDRLVGAVLSHNDGRVRRFLTLAATARETAQQLDAPDAEGRYGVWARHLHGALGESWPVGHPAHVRYDR